jgi:hypothetical protein
MRQLLLLPLILAACSAETMTDTPRVAPPGSAVLSSGVVEHSVTGSGVQAIAPGFKYTLEASVHSDANGKVSGQLYVRVLDLSLFGIPGTYEVREEPTCMRIVGNTAYIGARVTKSTDPVLAPVGALAVFWVRDGGPNGADVGHEGPAYFYDPNGLICSDTPPTDLLTADPITPGNFVVR